MDLQFYRIESERDFHRFVSNVNGCIGQWQQVYEDAVKDGENHKALLLQFQPQKNLPRRPLPRPQPGASL